MYNIYSTNSSLSFTKYIQVLNHKYQWGKNKKENEFKLIKFKPNEISSIKFSGIYIVPNQNNICLSMLYFVR